MSFLSNVQVGKVKRPHLILLYGRDKVGKSTFASQAPKPIFLGTEDGTANLSVTRGPSPAIFEDVLAAIDELTNEEHPFKTLVIDSIDWLEPLVWEKVCRDGGKDRIEDFGYGAGHKNTIPEWRKLVAALKRLRNKKEMNVILIAHSQIKTFNDPITGVAYDRHELKLYDKACAIVREFVDCILFATPEIFLKKEKGQRKGFAFGAGDSIAYTELRPGFDAGNRLGLPFQIPLTWKDFEAAVPGNDENEATLMKARIVELLPSLKDESLIKTVTQRIIDAGEDSARMSKILERVRELETESTDGK